MPLHTGRALHIDQPLSNIMLNRRPEGYIAGDLLPILNVSKQSDIYRKRQYKESFRVQPNLTARAPGTKPKEVFWTVSSDTYYAKNYALGTFWTAEDEVNADDAIRLNEESAIFVTDLLLNDMEYRVAQLANTSTNVYTTTSVTTSWNSASALILNDILNQKEAFRQRNGVLPNTMVVPEQIMTHVRRNDQIRDILFGDRGGLATESQIAGITGISKVLVPRIMVNTAPLYETALGSGTLSNAWGNFVHFAHVSALPGRNVDTWMQGFRWTDPALGVPFAIQRHQFDTRRRRQDIDGMYYQDEKIISTDLCFRVDSLIP